MKVNKISIITICYNNESDIERTILSVINQTVFQNIEYIVVDGKSTDATMEIVNKYKDKISTTISERDKGIYDAINKGIKLATGDVVGLIHAGDILFNNHIIGKVLNFFNNFDVDIIYGHDIIVNKNGRVVRDVRSPKYSKIWLKLGWMPPHQSLYIRKELFDQYGYYRLDQGGSADYEFVIRYFYKFNLKISRMNEYFLKFSLGGLSTSQYNRILNIQFKQLNCWRVNDIEPPFYLIFFKLWRKIPQFIRAYRWRFKKI